MKQQREVLRVETEVTGCPLCDGCGKMIETKTFYKWLARNSGEDYWGDYDFDIELHSHCRKSCIGAVMVQIFAERD